MAVLNRRAAGASGWNLRYIWFISMAAAMGGLLFGYDWVVIGGAKPFYEAFFHLRTPAAVAWAMSSALIGCLFGAVASGLLSDRFGRKRLLLFSALLFAASSLGTGMAGSFTIFLAWRISGGVAIGLASNLSPMYIAEVAPEFLRGRLVAVNQLTIVIGLLGAQTVNWLIARPVPPGATPADILAIVERPAGMALDVRRHGDSCGGVSVGHAVCAGEPALAGARTGNGTRARAVLERIGGTLLADRESWTRSRRRRPKRRPAWISANCWNRAAARPGARRLSGGVPAVVRHQRGLQLRARKCSRRPATRSRIFCSTS